MTAPVIVPSRSSTQAPAAAARSRLSPPPPALEVRPENVPGTRTDLAVVASRPTGLAEGDVRPTITFSAPVKALEAIVEDEAPPARLEPAVKGAWRWLGSASVEFVPEAPLPMSTTFKVTVPAGLVALNGARLNEPYVFEFHTPPPQLQQSAPWNGYRWLQPDQVIGLTFNQPVHDPLAHLALLVGEPARAVPLTLVRQVDVATEAAEELRARGWRGEGAGRGYRNRQTRYELKPTTPLPANEPVRVVVKASLRGADGPLTLGEERTLEFRTFGPMEIVTVRACSEGWEHCPWGPLVLETSNEADPASLKDRVKIEPAVEIDWDRVEVTPTRQWGPERPPEVALYGRFRPGTTYKVQIAAGVLDVFGQRAAARAVTLRTSDLEPMFDTGSDLALLEASGDRALPIAAANLRTVEAELWALTPEEAAPLLLDGGRRMKFEPGRAGARVTLDVSGKRNVQRDWPLDLTPALGDKPSGIVLARVWTPDLPHANAAHKAPVLAQITDLAVHARFGATGGVLWVTRLSDGRVVPNAQLRILDRAGAVRWTGVSDGDGLATIPGLATLVPDGGRDAWSAPPAVAVAELDGQVAVTASTWNEGLHPAAFDLAADWQYARPQALGVLFTDRGIYRPGDEVFVRGLARTRRL
ncbi:MAG: Ig-like domain-containing protein, partial [Myxococcales bacterium]